MTVIEIRPFRNGWKCFEAPGVEPVFLNQADAIRLRHWPRKFLTAFDSPHRLEREKSIAEWTHPKQCRDYCMSLD